MKKSYSDRILEILPFTFSIGAILLPIILTFYFPLAIGVFILIFSAIWFARAMEFSIFLVYSYWRYRQASKTDWKMKNINWEQGENLKKTEKLARNQLLKDSQYLAPSKVKHLIIVPTYKEELPILLDTVESLKRADYNLEQVFFCLATEERDQERGLTNAAILKEKYKNCFGAFFHFEHPDGIPGEVKGKGGNITHAGRQVSKKLEESGYNLEEFVVTTLDADNKIHPNYLQILTFNYIAAKDRQQHSYQPLPFYFNNIWEVPTINRVVSLTSSFWHMIENGRPDRLRNFASHAQPLKALKDMDFWATDTIVEDGHQFWRSYLHFKGNYAVLPIYLPIYFDAFQGKNYFRSIKGQFLQLRRWAWGVTDLPFMAKKWWQKSRELPFWPTLVQFYRLFEGHFMWSAAPLLIGLTTPMVQFINWNYQHQVFTANANLVISTFFQIAIIGLFIAMGVSLLTLPAPAKWWQKLMIPLQWLLLPPITLFMGSFPALTAQLYLAIGKRLEFNVTPKIRKNLNPEVK